MTALPPDEIELRRNLSVAALRQRDREAWQAAYQEACDREYWARGKCCAGCDNWQSDSGFTGRCAGAGIVSGQQVMQSMGVSFSSYTPAPGFPFTAHDHVCGLFRDGFDWSALDRDYLARIGALRDGQLREKP